MNEVCCVAEQGQLPAVQLLQRSATVTVCPLAGLLKHGWQQPLVLLGDVLLPEVATLIQRAYRAQAPLIVMAPLPVGEVTRLLDAPAPVNIVRRSAEQIHLVDPFLRQTLGRDALQILCNETVETALRGEILATANQQPVLWAYRPTRASTPVLWAAPQLLLVSARTDPLDREDLLMALLAWAHAQIQPTSPQAAINSDGTQTQPIDPALLRALVVALSVHPELKAEPLTRWLAESLDVAMTPTEVAAAAHALAELGAIDATDNPVPLRLSQLLNEWGLRAWAREVQRLETQASNW